MFLSLLTSLKIPGSNVFRCFSLHWLLFVKTQGKMSIMHGGQILLTSIILQGTFPLSFFRTLNRKWEIIGDDCPQSEHIVASDT